MKSTKCVVYQQSAAYSKTNATWNCRFSDLKKKHFFICAWIVEMEHIVSPCCTYKLIIFLLGHNKQTCIMFGNRCRKYGGANRKMDVFFNYIMWIIISICSALLCIYYFISSNSIKKCSSKQNKKKTIRTQNVLYCMEKYGMESTFGRYIDSKI